MFKVFIKEEDLQKLSELRKEQLNLWKRLKPEILKALENFSEKDLPPGVNPEVKEILLNWIKQVKVRAVVRYDSEGTAQNPNRNFGVQFLLFEQEAAFVALTKDIAYSIEESRLPQPPPSIAGMLYHLVSSLLVNFWLFYALQESIQQE